MKKQKKPPKKPKANHQTEIEFICENCSTTYKKDLLMSNEIRCPNCQSLKLFYNDNNKPTKLHRKIKKLFEKT
ncbi:Zn finger protein [Methanonatronarchaeum thermophilum]|uniref:Zn finger protein n=1 Tax=Methanonatronarchaeum thermophilum TaxID=1927129 RepID=A0A1Y3GD83_9EURY|nr:hypothetical protein [Methanonatronarchaeum thermophilum]OUJ19197.1 Zn finger protein [Methanonatronarchaeum thermophilum]